MKIQIEFTSSYEATIKIDGKTMKYNLIGKEEGLHPLTDQERENTAGGIVASKLCDVLYDILQAWLPENESPRGECWKTWEVMDDGTAEQMQWKMV